MIQLKDIVKSWGHEYPATRIEDIVKSMRLLPIVGIGVGVRTLKLKNVLSLEITMPQVIQALEVKESGGGSSNVTVKFTIMNGHD